MNLILAPKPSKTHLVVRGNMFNFRDRIRTENLIYKRNKWQWLG